jgi:hypothetical protein
MIALSTNSYPNRAPTNQRTAQVLSALYTYRFITNKQLFQLIIDPRLPESIQSGIRASIKDVTKRLTERGYLNRERTQIEGLQANEFLHWLTIRGLDYARRRCGVGDMYDYEAEARMEGRTHNWNLTQIHVALSSHFSFWEQRQAVLHVQGTKGEPKPDAFFKIGDFYSYLEVERGRQGNYKDGVSEQMRKVDRYIKYYESGAFKEKWKALFKVDVKNYFARFVFDNNNLAENFLYRVRTLHPETQLMRFWATGFDSLIENPAGHVWRTAHDFRARAYSLVERNAIELHPSSLLDFVPLVRKTTCALLNS